MQSQRSLVFCLVVAGACANRAPTVEEATETPSGSGGEGGVGPDATGGIGAVGGTDAARGGVGGQAVGGTPAGGSPTGACDEPVVSKRIVRLTFAQLAATLEALLGADVAADLRADLDIEDELQGFPPQLAASEGPTVTGAVYARSDAIAQWVFDYLMENFGDVSGCGADPDEGCAREFVESFAERAFRRPLFDGEVSKLGDLYDEAKDRSAPVDEAASWGAYAALEWPQFLYRTELGDSATQDGPLNFYELASELSYFLEDGPPDPELMAAAKAGALGDPHLSAEQVDRLLQTETARANLERALFAQFGMRAIYDTVVTADLDVELDTDLRDSMAEESRLFLHGHAWTEPLESLITSRRTFLNDELVSIYGVELPSGAASDDNGFFEVELPEERAGLLTQAAVLTAQYGIVPRSLWVMRNVLCAEIPPNVAHDFAFTDPAPSFEADDRTGVEFRTQTVPCLGCHASIDPYGVALNAFDALGRTRTAAAAGRPVSTTITLPELAGGETVDGAASMADLFASSDLFAPCLAQRFLSYALAGAADECRASEVLADFRRGDDRSFQGLARAIALSSALSSRKGGDP